jgi:hypothetical protein
MTEARVVKIEEVVDRVALGARSTNEMCVGQRRAAGGGGFKAHLPMTVSCMKLLYF